MQFAPLIITKQGTAAFCKKGGSHFLAALAAHRAAS
jgi:hypothetical protein